MVRPGGGEAGLREIAFLASQCEDGQTCVGAPGRDDCDSPVGDYFILRMAWVIGGGTPVGMFADMLAAGMNSNCGGGVHSAIFVEQQVRPWGGCLLAAPVARRRGGGSRLTPHGKAPVLIPLSPILWPDRD